MTADSPDSESSLDMGPQPLDALMESAGIQNHDLVAAAAGTGLTHKVVQKARKGRQLTAKAQRKVLAALNGARKAKDLPPAAIGEAFNYRGR